MKILIISNNNHLGDTIALTPLFAGLKISYPHALFYLLATNTDYQIPLKEINSYIHEIIPLDTNNKLDILNKLMSIRSIKFDIAIAPSTIRISTTSNILLILSKAKIKVGVKQVDHKINYLHFFLNKKSSFNWNKEKTNQYIRALNIAQILDPLLKIDDLNINIKKKEILDSGNTTIVVHPGAGKIENIWPVNSFADALIELSRLIKVTIILIGGPKDTRQVKKLKQFLTKRKVNCTTLFNLSIQDLKSLFSKSTVFLCNDSGPMHLAAISGIKVISIFGPTESKVWGPPFANVCCLQSKTKKIDGVESNLVVENCLKILK